MNTILGAVFAAFSILIFLVMTHLVFHERGYRRGHKKGFHEGVEIGYQRGHQDADNWWISSESEADRERQKIWKEER